MYSQKQISKGLITTVIQQYVAKARRPYSDQMVNSGHGTPEGKPGAINKAPLIIDKECVFGNNSNESFKKIR